MGLVEPLATYGIGYLIAAAAMRFLFEAHVNDWMATSPTLL